MTQLHGWGRYPRADGAVSEPRSAAECAQAAAAAPPVIARGLGRSYGDSALAPRVLSTRRLDRFRSFDAQTGLLACEAGVSLDAILQLVLPHGWFLPVTPGTRFVTLGGAIASDVHGKDHHANGTFTQHVRELELLLGDGATATASPACNPDLFHATCGGMGLTGVILAATVQLRRIASTDIVQTTRKLPCLQALLEAFEAEAASTYSVAWIDCASTGAARGRSLLMLGEHADSGPLAPLRGGALRVPVDMPHGLLGRTTAAAFNALHYGRVRQARSVRRVGLAPFFYPLDALQDWNRLYGAGGFVQYQFVLPMEAGAAPLADLLRRIADSGQPSFLGVLKKFGPANRNPLSFPLEGYTLALDFRADAAVFALLAELDAVVLDHGGRIYLAKDARMTAATFRRCYPRWEEFEATRARWRAHGRFASAQSRRLGLL